MNFLRTTLAATLLSAAALAPIAQPHAQAQSLPSAVYSSEKSCKSGYTPHSETHSYLTREGVEEFEGGCFFLKIFPDTTGATGRKDDFAGFVALGYCQEPGATTPYIFHVRRFSELASGKYTLMLSYQDRGKQIEVEYYPCPGKK
ncbi:MAG: hypothetical protein MRY74_03255 [Neomegalonema sp.]|nr:hypothetical protein [Neomegalonema sp.]